MRALIATVLFALIAQLPPAVPQPRDGVARDPDAITTATGIIRGRVTDRESGQPLARVIVELVPDSYGDGGQHPRTAGPTSEPRTAVTGADGRYEYTRVPAGVYFVFFDASTLRGTHLPGYFGEVELANEMVGAGPTPLQLADGEVRGDVSGALSRSLAIEGRVFDELGDPMARVQVSAQPADGPAGISMSASRSTDDRGAFRVFGLRPGRYRICANPHGHVPLTEGSRDRAIRTCYPGATLDANAEPVVLSGTDIGGIDIRLQRSRAFTVTGTVINSSGAPVERAQINLVDIGTDAHDSNTIELRSGGQFVARSVSPGDYEVQVSIGDGSSDDKREPELGSALVRVSNADVGGIVVVTTLLGKVAGRILFEDGTFEKRSEPMRVNAEASSALRGMSSGSWSIAEVRSDLTFELTGFVGPHIITVTGQPPEWVVRSVKYRDDDITDTPIELKASTHPAVLEITMTRRGAVVSGRVLDPTGAGSARGYVLLMMADPARRQFGQGTVKTTRSKFDGSFTLDAVRPGEYVILAVTAATVNNLPLNEPEDLERVARAGERIVLVENEKREIRLRVVTP